MPVGLANAIPHDAMNAPVSQSHFAARQFDSILFRFVFGFVIDGERAGDQFLRTCRYPGNGHRKVHLFTDVFRKTRFDYTEISFKLLFPSGLWCYEKVRLPKGFRFKFFACKA